jgi:DNA-binding NarL/FixJ family response regulator
MTSRRETRILVVDRHAQARRGMMLVFQAEGTFTCLEARDRREALAIARSEPPDAAIVDVSPDEEDGLQLVRELSDQRIPVVVSSLNDDPSGVRAALRAGAHAYVTKRETRFFVRAVRAAIGGWLVVSPRAAQGLHGDRGGDFRGGNPPRPVVEIRCR